MELVVGRILSAEDHVGGRGPSYIVRIDLGPRGQQEAVLANVAESKDELTGRQVVCTLDEDGAAVLGAHSHASGVVLVAPDREVEDGSPVA
jgi:tRNA-binding EMAP/Myf-like protein